MNGKIDRYALVSRHDIFMGDNDRWTAVGNGELCFTSDRTGLQTFSGNTLAHWGWHSFPEPRICEKGPVWETGTYQKGRLTGKGVDGFPPEKAEEWGYLRENAHLFDLVRLRFALPGGGALARSDISASTRHVCLWTGLLTARFSCGGGRVTVESCVHPHRDVIGISVTAEGLEDPISFCGDFPYPSLECCGTWVADFDRADAHTSEITLSGDSASVFRRVDGTDYFARFSATGDGEFYAPGAHTLALDLPKNGRVELCVGLSKEPWVEPLPGFEECKTLSAKSREAFWLSGGAIDLSESDDPRWFELERRIVLSQHILALQSSGSFPCSEAGITNIDPWCGRSHMEMLWWHAAHFFMWGRPELADEQLSWYGRFLPVAKKLAAQLDSVGAKWGKSVDCSGRSAPWEGNLALLWKQPHPIFFAELEYRVRPGRPTLEKWAEIIEATADHMADIAVWGEDGFCHLDPVMPPSELGFTRDTVFDLAYWQWGLETANLWRERMGLEKKPEWDAVAKKLCPLPVHSGVYIRSPEWTRTYEDQNYEHPDPVGVWGMLPPTELADRETARATLVKIWNTWQRDRVWGWDFPWIAMCASRTGEPDIAVDAMMYVDIDATGACGAGSYPYLPANGGILFAAAMMAVGSNGEHAPGFPEKGWKVRAEGLLNW